MAILIDENTKVIVQGITEFLPVSSSGHLALVPWLFGWDDFAGDPALENAFDVSLHLGTLVGAAAYLRDDIRRYGTALLASVAGRSHDATDARIGGILLVTVLPAGLIGLLVLSSTTDLGDRTWLVAVSLIGFGLLYNLWICVPGTLMVLGSIYAGVATPTEAAALGVLGAALFAFINRRLNLGGLLTCLVAAVKTTCMICLIVMGASYLSRVMGFLGIPAAITKAIVGLHLSPYLLMLMLGLVYIILGCILDGFSIVVMTLPIALPMVTAAGFDPLWFGIYLILMVELSQITPPVGFNLFVIQGLTGKSIGDIAIYALPFFILMLVTTAIITVFPQIALYLPRLMSGG